MEVSKAQKRPRALRFATGKVRKVIHHTELAAAVIGEVQPGIRITGITAGQFSNIDAVDHLVDQLHPCDVRITTWTTGIYDVDRCHQFVVAGRINKICMLLDRGSFERSPQYAGPLIKQLGADAFRCMSVHSKVNIVSGARGCAVMRSSMNLNKNLRTEQFDIDVDDGGPDSVSEFYRVWFDELWEQAGESHDNRAIIDAVYGRFVNDPKTAKAARSPSRTMVNPWFRD